MEAHVSRTDKGTRIGQVLFDNGAPLAIIAGPCMIESEAMIMETAARLKDETARRGIGLVFKASYDKANRQSLESPRGIGIRDGLKILARVRDEFGLPVLTDIHNPGEADVASSVVDCLQIPAFLCRQTDLVVAAAVACAARGRALNIKKGQFLAPEQMRAIVEKATRSGAAKVLVTERGVSFGYHDLVFDPRSLSVMKEFSTVIFDVSHAVQRPGAAGDASGGDRRFIPDLARAATGVGIAGLFLETHPNPDAAFSDRETQWPLDQVGPLLDEILAVDRAVKSSVRRNARGERA
jgi:2-dehydro-3-deoxyphosphooctonate aldolase (KDO 8-P synthase)